jgi:hypothetical protein
LSRSRKAPRTIATRCKPRKATICSRRPL